MVAGSCVRSYSLHGLMNKLPMAGNAGWLVVNSEEIWLQQTL